MKSEKELPFLSKMGYFIRQGYLDEYTRIREKIPFKIINKKFRSLAFESTYQVATKAKTKKRVVEVEQTIDRRDFEDLWNIAKIKLTKTRYDLYFGEAKWEIDYFRKNKKIYFALAEHEMPEGFLKPDFIPQPIKKHILLAVPINNSGYSSRRLASISYAKKIIKKL